MYKVGKAVKMSKEKKSGLGSKQPWTIVFISGAGKRLFNNNLVHFVTLILQFL